MVDHRICTPVAPPYSLQRILDRGIVIGILLQEAELQHPGR